MYYDYTNSTKKSIINRFAIFIPFFWLLLLTPLQAQYFFKQYESSELSNFCSTSIEKINDGYRMYAEKTEDNIRQYLSLEVDDNGNEQSRQIVSFDISEDHYLRLRDGNFVKYTIQSNGAQAQKISPDGQVFWTQDLSGDTIEGLSSNILENEAGMIFLGHYDTSIPSIVTMYRLDANDGIIQWSYQTEIPVFSSSTQKADGIRLLFPTNDNGLIFNLFLCLRFRPSFEYTIHLNGVGSPLSAREDSSYRPSGSFEFIGGNNSNFFKFERKGFRTPESRSYAGNEDYNWRTFYNFKEYGSQFSGLRLYISAVTSTAGGDWLLAGFKREYPATFSHVGGNNLAEGTYRQEMHLAKLDPSGNVIFTNLNYPVVGLIKNISEMPDGKIMLSGLRNSKPWMMLVNDNGVPNDVSCTEEIDSFEFIEDFRGHHYFLSDQKMPYTKAEQNAQANGGYITAIEDGVEQGRLYSAVRNTNQSVFIGLNDLEEEGRPKWDNGEPISFEAFKQNTQNTLENDVVSLTPWASEWVWENRFTERQYFLELDCEEDNAPILEDLPENLGFTGCIGVPSSEYFRYDRIAEASSTAVEAGFNTTHWWKAVDKDLNTYMQTKAEEQPSWFMRFGGYRFWVEEVRIYPRNDGQFPLENLILEVDNFSSEISIPIETNGGAPIVIPVGRLARSIRLQKQDFGVLSFAEIEVDACNGGGLYEQLKGFQCPDDVILQAGPNGKVTFNLEDYDFQLNCLGSGNGGSKRLGPKDGDELLPGEYLYEIRSSNDVCGSQYCNFKITVLPFESGNGEITLTTCEDIFVETGIGQVGAVVNWALPTATTTCSLSNIIRINQEEGQENGSYFEVGTHTVTYLLSDTCNNNLTCTFNVIVETGSNATCPDIIPDFELLGEFEGSKYYMSNKSKRWLDARAQAVTNGGYLASINSAAENEFLRTKLQNRIVHIGYNNINGTATWESSEAVTYTNLDPNSASTGYAQMSFWSGTWQLRNGLEWKRFLLEIPCESNLSESIEQRSSLDALTDLVLNPNPTSEFAIIKLQSALIQNTRLVIFNANGQKVLKQIVYLSKGDNEIVVSINHLPVGVYVLKLQNCAMPLRFVKME